jgi:nitroreductase/NAD-dependent dihydropyrimidine dehydrogenase PreA subunit
MTLLVDETTCTRCGICSIVCPMRLIGPADEITLPRVKDEKAGMCIACGHCEVNCPSQSLILNVRPDERVSLTTGAGMLAPEDLGIYLKKRRTVRHYTKELVPREKIEAVLDIARYAASGGNAQPVQWLVVHDPEEVHRLAGLTVDWMRSIMNNSHPMSGYVPSMIAAWERGYDPICRGAPHLVIAHIPEGNPGATTDAIIALTHFDIAAPAFGIGTCWAGFLSIAVASYEPLQKALGLPAGRKYAYGLVFGNPKYKIYGIPRRNPLQITWR